MDVFTFNNQTDLPLQEAGVLKIVEEVLALEKQSYHEAAIHFVDLKTICGLHKQYFQDPSPTDCISFPMDEASEEGYKVLGEVFICPQTALDYVSEHGGDPYQETTLYLIHGLLHLMGYNDISNEDREKMRQAEQRHLLNLSKRKIILKPPDNS